MHNLQLSFVLVLLACPSAYAAFPGNHLNDSIVIGANLVVALGDKANNPRLGFGLDLGYQWQYYTMQGEYITEDTYYVWPEEHLAPGYGPMAHLWWQAGSWQASIGASLALTRPIRVGLEGGWWPGLSLGAELGYLVSTRGFAGIDMQAIAEATWLEVRAGQALTREGWQAQRLHVGVLSPTEQPELWLYGAVGWDPPGDLF